MHEQQLFVAKIILQGVFFVGVLESFKLNGYCSIITGGAIGLGKAMAKALAEAGSNIVIADINTEAAEETVAEINGIGREAIAVKCDVTSVDDSNKVVTAAVEKFGKIDVLVNNAGICKNIKTEDMIYEDWLKVINVNLNSVFIMSQAVGRVMIKQKKGSIINISSMSGIIVNTPQPQCSYNASKGGAIMLTKSLASEWVDHNIRVNTIAPTYMETDLIRGTIENKDNKSMIQKWVDFTPMKRFGKPEEIGGLTVYLASEASSLATGSVFVIDGGYTIW